MTKPKYVINASRVLTRIGEQNLTQAEAARAAGFHPVHFHKLVTGIHAPSVKSRRRLMASEVFAGLGFHDLFEQVQVGGDAR